MPFTLDKTRWVATCQFMATSFKAGFKCNECGTWRHASEFLVCKCDTEKQYVIAGQDHGEPTWWNNENGWVHEFVEATTFPAGIFGESLPPGSVGVLEMTLTGEYVKLHQTPPSPTVSNNSWREYNLLPSNVSKNLWMISVVLWSLFSSVVVHSRFETLLSVLMPFTWLINDFA